MSRPGFRGAVEPPNSGEEEYDDTEPLLVTTSKAYRASMDAAFTIACDADMRTNNVVSRRLASINKIPHPLPGVQYKDGSIPVDTSSMDYYRGPPWWTQ